MAIDIETACDESVLSVFNMAIKPRYCNSLLRFAHAPRYATMPLCFGEGDFTKRIKDILNYQKPTFWAICSGTLLAVILCITCLLNPFADTQTTIPTEDEITIPASTSTPPEPTVAPSSAIATTEPNEKTSDEFAQEDSVLSSTQPPVSDAMLTQSESTPTNTDNSATSNTTSTTSDAIVPTEQTADSDISFIWPVPDYDYISCWTVANEHDGIDIAAEAGTAIYAAAGGVVLEAGYNAAGTGYGYSVVIAHGEEYQTLYAHGLSVEVSAGDTVEQGDLIMHVGSTGYSSDNHLHFEIFINEDSFPFTEEQNLFAIP